MFTIRMWKVQRNQMAQLSSKCPRGVVAGEKFLGASCEVSSVPLPKSLLDRQTPRVYLGISSEGKEGHMRGTLLLPSTLPPRDGLSCTMKV